jgi:protein involved in polysaccharide export with SLBB domain
MLLITTLFALLAFGSPQMAAPAEYVVGPQDVLSIVVFGEEDLKKTGRRSRSMLTVPSTFRTSVESRPAA